MRRVLLALILAGLTASALKAQDVDLCKDILRYGIFDTAYVDLNHKDFQLFQYSYCHNTNEEDRKTLGQQFNSLTPQGAFASRWNAASESKKHELFCSNELRTHFTELSLTQFFKTASPIIVGAWERCMAPHASAKLSARQSNDFKSVALEADSGVRGLNLTFNGRTDWKDQLLIVPPDGLLCNRGFSTRQTRDSISCARPEARLNEKITVKLLTEYGDTQPVIELLPATDIGRIGPGPITSVTYLSEDLEISNSLQYRGYQELHSFAGRQYEHGLVVASPDAAAGSLTYEIPVGAKRFKAWVTNYRADCGGGGPINGWRVTVKTPVRAVSHDMAWNYGDAIEIDIPVDDVPPTYPQELTITVDPQWHRTCDHSAIGDPHFIPGIVTAANPNPATSASDTRSVAVPVNDKGEVAASVAAVAQPPSIPAQSFQVISAFDKGCCLTKPTAGVKTSWECYEGWTRANCIRLEADSIVESAEFFRNLACGQVDDCPESK